VIDDWILPGENVFKVITWDSRQIRFLKEVTDDSFSTKAIQDLRKSQRVKSDKDILWVRSQGGEARTITVVYY
jgi:hypothetical protein